MALYTTDANATARLSRYAGLTVPTGSDLDLYISDASNVIENYIGYEWAEKTGLQAMVEVSRSGQAQIIGVDGWLVKLNSLDSIVIPPQSIYYGYTISTEDIEWDANGQLSLIALPVKHVWRSPVLNLSDYPGELQITYSTIPNSASPPPIFDQVCCQIIAAMIMQFDDPDTLIASSVGIKEMGLQTNMKYKDEPFADILKQIGRWRKE